MNMNITIHIENANVNDVARVLAALAGTGVPVVTVAAPPKAPKAEKQKEAPAPEPVKPDTVVSSGPVSTPENGVPPLSSGQTATTAASPSDAVPDEATLTAAANNAIAKLGAGAQAKIKAYIADNFQKDDGSPAGLRTVRADQRARLLADLEGFAAGTKVI